MKKHFVKKILLQHFQKAVCVIKEKCPSTHSEIKKVISKNPEVPVLLLAGEQTAGYGRFGRKFFSPRGGLWFSLFIPGKNTVAGENTALVVAGKVKEVLNRKYHLKLKIKKPNDIVSADGRKLAGVLVTKRYRGSKFTGGIIGIGINVNNETDFEGVAAVSLKELNGGDISAAEVLNECLQCVASLVYD